MDANPDVSLSAKRYRLTILGLGNLLFKDEGFGVHFVREFQGRYRLPEDVAVLDGGTLGYMLMDDICRTEHLLVVDTVRADDEPGSIYRFTPEAIPLRVHYNVSAHEVEFLDVLSKAAMLGEAPETVIIAVVPEDIVGTGIELTPSVRACLPKVEALVKEELHRMGIAVDDPHPEHVG
ncbi:MAG: HyaD/HybD family hydrogenase maturation endopeptidase [bacterium]